MPMLTNAEADAMRELIAKGRALWKSSQLIKAVEGRSIARTDVAMVKFMTALKEAEQIDKLEPKP